MANKIDFGALKTRYLILLGKKALGEEVDAEQFKEVKAKYDSIAKAKAEQQAAEDKVRAEKLKKRADVKAAKEKAKADRAAKKKTKVKIKKAA